MPSPSLIRPGILVALKTSVAGGVQYRRRNLDPEFVETPSDPNADVKRWETTRVVNDPDEHTRAVEARSKAAYVIRALCAKTDFGLLCPQARESALDDAISAANRIVLTHNASAKEARVAIYVIKGRIADTDEEAARAIGAELSGLLEQMNASISELKPDDVRAAAGRARQLAAMLSDEQSEKVSEAIKAARIAATAIVKRVQRNGEVAAIVLSELDRAPIESARLAMLDLDVDAPASSGPALPPVDVQRFDLDLDEDAAASCVPAAE